MIYERNAEHEIAANNTRVYGIANATIQDNITAERVVKYLKMRNAWDHLSELWIPCSGLKIEGNPLIVSDIYGVKGVHNLSQATGAAQPIYANNYLLFDNTDDYLNKINCSKAQVLSLTDNGNFTFQWVGKIPYGAVNSQNTLFYFSGDSNNRFYVNKQHITGNKLRIRFVTVIDGVAKIGETDVANAPVYDENTIIQITIQYTASTGVVASYINGVSIVNPVNTVDDINNLIGNLYSITIGKISAFIGNYTLYGCAFFRGILTPEQCKLEIV